MVRQMIALADPSSASKMRPCSLGRPWCKALLCGGQGCPQMQQPGASVPYAPLPQSALIGCRTSGSGRIATTQSRLPVPIPSTRPPQCEAANVRLHPLRSFFALWHAAFATNPARPPGRPVCGAGDGGRDGNHSAIVDRRTRFAPAEALFGWFSEGVTEAFTAQCGTAPAMDISNTGIHSALRSKRTIYDDEHRRNR